MYTLSEMAFPHTRRIKIKAAPEIQPAPLIQLNARLVTLAARGVDNPLRLAIGEVREMCRLIVTLHNNALAAMPDPAPDPMEPV